MLIERVNGVADIKPHVSRHLIIARARGVQAACGAADELSEPALDIHMNVFKRAGEGEITLFDFAGDLIEPLGDGFGILSRDNALLSQHRDMGLRALDILSPQCFVKAN